MYINPTGHSNKNMRAADSKKAVKSTGEIHFLLQDIQEW